MAAKQRTRLNSIVIHKMSGDIKDDKDNTNETDKTFISEYKEETWGKSVDGEFVTDGYKFRGKQPFKKAKEEIEKLMIRGNKFKVGKIELIVLDARNKGIELEVDVRMTENENRGVAIVKLYGPNKRKENTVTITKSKQSDVKFVSLMAERVIRPLIKKFLGLEDEETNKKPKGIHSCHYCEKTFKTASGMKRHVTTQHKSETEIPKETMNLSKSETEILLAEQDDNEDETNLEEILDIKEQKKYTFQCSNCEQYFETFRKYGLIQKILKHREACGTTDTKQNRKTKDCQSCDFKANNEVQLKRHKRDSHDIMSVSTSPPPKKSRFSQNEQINTDERMETDESESEKMEVDNWENEESARSKRMDEKILAQAKKIEEEDRNYEERKKKEEERKKENEEIESKKKKDSVRKRKQKIKLAKRKSLKKKDSNIPNLKPVPKNILNFCNKGDKIYTVPGDGACGANSVAAHLFKDEIFGPKLRQQINDFKVKHWHRKYNSMFN